MDLEQRPGSGTASTHFPNPDEPIDGTGPVAPNGSVVYAPLASVPPATGSLFFEERLGSPDYCNYGCASCPWRQERGLGRPQPYSEARVRRYRVELDECP